MALRKLSTAALRRELAVREKAVPKLQAEHAKLASRLAEITAELAELGEAAPARRGRKPGRPKGSGRGPGRPKGSKNRKPGRPKGSGGKRAKNAVPLPEAIRAVVKAGSTVSPAEVAATVLKGGFKTTAKNFGMMVSNALAKLPDFKRKGRGQYLRVGTGGAKAKAARKKPAGRKRAAGKPAAKRPAAKAAGKPGRKAKPKAAPKPAQAPETSST